LPSIFHHPTIIVFCLATRMHSALYSLVPHASIGVTYEGTSTPTGLGVPYPHFTFQDTGGEFAVIRGDLWRLKPFSAGVPPRTSSPEAHVLSRFPSMRSLREGLKRCDARSLCHNLFLSTLVLLSLGTITLTYFTISESESESECKCLTCNQKPTRSQFSLLYCISIRIGNQNED